MDRISQIIIDINFCFLLYRYMELSNQWGDPGKDQVDQSFIRDALVNKDDQAITRTIINLGHSLGIRHIVNLLKLGTLYKIILEMSLLSVSAHPPQINPIKIYH